MKLLYPVLEHWSIILFEHIFSDFDDKIWAHPKNGTVKGCMMKFTERDPVVYNWSTLSLCIRNDVSRIKKFLMLQSAQGALCPVYMDNLLPKTSLMKTCLNQRGNISPSGFSLFQINVSVSEDQFLVVSCNGEGKGLRIIPDDIDRPFR